MVVIWGLDLKEMQWGKFKSSYMWNNEYHLRRTKFIVYQCAMIFCVVSESLGTAALSDYVDQQDFVSAHSPGATVHNNNFTGIASYNIFVGIYVATIFGSAFFFDLFWPERHESYRVKIAWRVCSILACLFTLSAALTFTIILAMRSAYVTGTDANTAERLLREYGGSPMKYRDNGRGIASVVFLWPGMVATVASTLLLWHSLSHIDAYGPRSAHTRTRDDIINGPDGSNEKSPENGSEALLENEVRAPEPAHARSEGVHDQNESAN
ncbi:uncharacterized protein BDR25DRAFT_208746 [Lindgomyces ingoldianus]|uniref:Uncharacterized protein n=1 Tax=Lindgomyces ingoldianus TaxID=673940 RepID=A0ACB6RCB1_9PLEO|nr:uncharacterized protein BDR25DRAFT_208746 [Lindgomyces ingoldianus]KAF2476821.1 hypothetical protein BDR25DRAFT_208746 [Lindgomyces ingoldianus]